MILCCYVSRPLRYSPCVERILSHPHAEPRHADGFVVVIWFRNLILLENTTNDGDILLLPMNSLLSLHTV